MIDLPEISTKLSTFLKQHYVYEACYTANSCFTIAIDMPRLIETDQGFLGQDSFEIANDSGNKQ
ncbi:hypothetical protein [Bartonella apihabitans]|uniref:hypothetical protein n=1 Tax=Bartonella apihabitans TaxID=2750929 RepID=UPI003BB7CDC8